MPRQPLIAAKDLRRFAANTGSWLAAQLTPTSWDPKTVAAVQRLWARTKRKEVGKIASRIEAAAPGRFPPEQAERLAAEWLDVRAELILLRARAMQGRAPEVRLETAGAERLRAALERGRGAVLWFSSFTDSWLLFRGLADAGFPVRHLSQKFHGAPSGSRFGYWTLTRFQRVAEDPWLDQRIILDQRGVAGYAKQILRALEDNKPVTLRGDLLPKGRPPQAAVFGRTVGFNPGAPAFAYRAGAALLTACCRRSRPFEYRIEIDEEIERLDGAARDEYAAAAVGRYAERLERRLDESSADYEAWWWFHLMAGD